MSGKAMMLVVGIVGLAIIGWQLLNRVSQPVAMSQSSSVSQNRAAEPVVQAKKEPLALSEKQQTADKMAGSVIQEVAPVSQAEQSAVLSGYLEDATKIIEEKSASGGIDLSDPTAPTLGDRQASEEASISFQPSIDGLQERKPELQGGVVQLKGSF
ncbi:MAG: hypothetical protein HQL67_08715 [Magnetococcales bacterium]|nr:hypothetical protein [Magnetococcales bacterium]